MELLRRSNFGATLNNGAFFWAAGIEDTFITHPWPGTGRMLDEYELTEHYARWREDMDLFAELRVPVVRYGIPWHRINPARGKWDWSFPDRALDRLLELEIEPVVDLVHYGLPAWIEGAYLNPDFPRIMAEYARRAAERYIGRIHCYTPLNEPRVTSWYCGKLGWWPPAQRGWRGFVRVMSGVCAGIVETVHALREVDSDILCAHVDATDLYESTDPSLADEVNRRQGIVFLALDLVSGRIIPGHPLHDWLLKWGMEPARLEWFQQRKIDLDLIGINLYPLFSRKVLKKSKQGLRISMPYASAEIIDRIAALYWERYRAPLFISETASEGTVKRRMQWLQDSVQATGRVRSRGIPLLGYTWWPLFALVTWGYRQGHHPPEYYLKQMGLWDLKKTESGLERVRTPLVQAYKELAASGSAAFGEVRAAA